MDKIKKVLIISSDKPLREVLNFCFDGWGYEVFIQEPPLSSIDPVKKMAPEVIIIDVHSGHKSHLEICRILKEDFLTAFIPIITLVNKRQLRTQLLNLKQGVDDYLIKPPDPLDLRLRVEMAMKRSQYGFHTTPLTGLPGGRIIEEILTDKLNKDAAFSFGYVDVDNFKYFNDVYGYLKGDRVIMQTAYLLYNVIKGFGNAGDFIGHIGGDDFVFVSTPDKYKDICSNFIGMFDQIIPFHYSAQDRQQGFIVARDRARRVRKVPLMNISVAVVNHSGSSEINNVIQINERVAEIKGFLKTLSGSKFMADRRCPGEGAHALPQVYQKKEGQPQGYKPLGQILLEKGIISVEQLDDALRSHWKRGVMLGEVLKEMGLIKDEELKQALSFQRRNQEAPLPFS